MTTLTQITEADFLTAAQEEYVNVYLRDQATNKVDPAELRALPIFTLDTQVDRDLHAYELDQAFALQWREQVLKRLGVNPRSLPVPPKGEYSLGTLYRGLVIQTS